LTSGAIYDIIIVSRGDGEDVYKILPLSWVKDVVSNLPLRIEKIFEKLFKNLLTNTTKCGIIYM
jgi:hypothetical protein